ncbi:glycosyltransferase family 2 protein [Parablautia muri]|uniref:Glycosyltransferase n=1 Tax=Parablautia muri TaxID=2320879 RepID=A0A9X5BGY4_9FIRM|nr:glycosyltransferase family 2 protein [Parablautia muri]NBJ92722.1 glycosyltransferase [Parablautia muri]
MKTVSLILTTYNSENNLKKTLKSIEDQDYPQIEVVIKDGGSSDHTLNIIREYEAKSRYTVKWTTGKDSGIYDAMNQGYPMASGDIIVFFNDLFSSPQAVSKMVRLMEEHPECVGTHADLVYVSEEKIIRRWKMGPQKSLYWGWIPGHPTLFLKREIYEKYGLYNPAYVIAADCEFMIRFLKDKGNRLEYLPETIVKMYYGGTSTVSLSSYLLSLKEVYRALKDNGIKGALWIDFIRTVQVMMQFFH